MTAVPSRHQPFQARRNPAALFHAAERRSVGRRVSLQDLGSIGEFVAAIATVATLVYLAVQIRMNTTTVRTTSHHAGSTAWSELVAKIAADPVLSEIYHSGRVTPDELSKPDARRFSLVFDAMLAQVENIYIQYANGQLPQSNQDRFANILRAQFGTPGVQQYWSRNRNLFTAEFVRYIEEELGLVSGNPE